MENVHYFLHVTDTHLCFDAEAQTYAAQSRRFGASTRRHLRGITGLRLC